jgi:hypothetical protein
MLTGFLWSRHGVQPIPAGCWQVIRSAEPTAQLHYRFGLYRGRITYFRWHFSFGTLLIAKTLVGAVVGLIVALLW